MSRGKSISTKLSEGFNPPRCFCYSRKSLLLRFFNGFLYLFNSCRLELFYSFSSRLFRTALSHIQPRVYLFDKMFLLFSSLNFNSNWIISESKGIANLRNDVGVMFYCLLYESNLRVTVAISWQKAWLMLHSLGTWLVPLHEIDKVRQLARLAESFASTWRSPVNECLQNFFSWRRKSSRLWFITVSGDEWEELQVLLRLTSRPRALFTKFHFFMLFSWSIKQFHFRFPHLF